MILIFVYSILVDSESHLFLFLVVKLKLRMKLMKGHVLQGWHEGTIKFAPTYKYIPNSDLYYGCFQEKKGEKRRSPAW